MDELLLFTIDEPFTALQTDGLLLTILIDELSPQHRWTSSYYLRLMSPSLHIKQTGSFIQFLLASSPLNTDGRALTIYDSRALTTLQTDGLLLTILIDKPFTTLQTDGLLPTILIDEPFTTLQTDRLLPTILTDEPLRHFKQMGSFLQFLLTSSPLNTDGRALTIYD